jgi:hypothetical protein
VNMASLLARSGHDRNSLKVDIEGAEAVMFSENIREPLTECHTKAARSCKPYDLMLLPQHQCS